MTLKFFPTNIKKFIREEYMERNEEANQELKGNDMGIGWGGRSFFFGGGG
jgi:hypothetical protein